MSYEMIELMKASTVLCTPSVICAIQLYHQYLRHPSILKAVIWCVATCGQMLLTQKISVQSDQWFLRYGQICVEKHTFSKCPQDAKILWEICHNSETTCPNELKFRLELDL